MKLLKIDSLSSLLGLLILFGLTATGVNEAYKFHSSDHPTLIKVRLVAEFDQARQVRVAGSFNNWQARCCLQKSDESNEWSINLKLAPGIYQYVLIVDDEEWNPEQGLASLPDRYNGRSGVLKVKELQGKKDQG